MEYMTPKEAAIKWNISERRVQLLCMQDRIKGSVRFGRGWAIPIDASKPEDARMNSFQKHENLNKN